MNNVFTFDKIFADRVFQIPDYQRGFAWQEQQLNDLLSDIEILDLGKKHYTGTIVLHEQQGNSIDDIEGSEYAVFNVVDGQQRMTALIILLDCIRIELLPLGEEILAAGIEKRYIKIQDPNEQFMYKLKLNRDCRDYFQDTILSSPISSSGYGIISHKLLSEAKTKFTKYLKDKKQELNSEYPEWLKSLRKKITQQMVVNLYFVDEEAEVGVIFEVMNDRGKPLSELEKVKNYLLYLTSKLNLEDHDLAVDINVTWTKLWEKLMNASLYRSVDENQLLRMHWIMKYDHDRKNWKGVRSIKERFSLKEYRDRHVDLLSDVKDYTKSLREAVIAYCDVNNPVIQTAFNVFTDKPDKRPKIVSLSEKICRLHVQATFLPMLMATRLAFPDDPAKYLELIDLCERYAFRVYRLFRKRADAGQTTLFRLGYELYHGEKEFAKIINEFKSTLLYYCPNEEFERKFVLNDDKNDWYNWKGGIKYLLYDYEESLTKHGDVGIEWNYLIKRDETIEHILPQKPVHEYWTSRFDEAKIQKYLHDLGNLCLTRDNSVYGNKPFDIKRGKPGSETPCYSVANLRMEQELAKFGEWNEDSILKRREKIIAWAKTRWLVEKTETEEVENAEIMRDEESEIENSE